MTARTDRIDQLLRESIGEILAKDIADPRIGFVTITDVETTPDLRHAKVWVSVIGGPAERRASLRGLADAMGYVQHELGRQLRLKRIPALHIQADETAERATRVLEVLADLEAGEEPGSAPAGETLPTPVARLPHEGDAAPDPADAADAPAEPSRPRSRQPHRGAPSHGRSPRRHVGTARHRRSR